MSRIFVLHQAILQFEHKSSERKRVDAISSQTFLNVYIIYNMIIYILLVFPQIHFANIELL